MDIEALEALKACPADELEEAITQIHAAQAAVHQSLLELILAYDESGAWRVNGAHSMAAYLSFRLRVSMPVAHSWVSAARALSSLPAVREAYAQGRISWGQVVALVPVATFDNEEELLGQALQMSASHFKTLCRGLVEVSDLTPGRRLSNDHSPTAGTRRGGSCTCGAGCPIWMAPW